MKARRRAPNRSCRSPPPGVARPRFAAHPRCANPRSNASTTPSRIGVERVISHHRASCSGARSASVGRHCVSKCAGSRRVREFASKFQLTNRQQSQHQVSKSPPRRAHRCLNPGKGQWVGPAADAAVPPLRIGIPAPCFRRSTRVARLAKAAVFLQVSVLVLGA